MNTHEHPNPPNNSSSQQSPTELYRKPSTDSDGRAVKKARASKPKVRSGCITCKYRRVKCDETKPECIRCQKFGRKCDGYAPEAQQSRGLLQLQPRLPSVSSYNPSISVHETEDESRYFQVFVERTIHELSGYFDGTVSSHAFWRQIVLPESHNVTSIRHAVIALGALTKSLDNCPRPYLKVNIAQDFDKRHLEQAVLQHIKAIQALNQYISSSQSPQLRNALITCLLFICFEVYQGSCVSSAQQTYSGLKILRSYYIGKSGSQLLTHGHPLSNWSRGPFNLSMSSQKIKEGSENVYGNNVRASHLEEYLQSEFERAKQPGIDVTLSATERASSEPAVAYLPFEGNLSTSVGSGSQIHRTPSMHFAVNRQPEVPISYHPVVSSDSFVQQDDFGNLSLQPNIPSGPPSRASSPAYSNASTPRERLSANSYMSTTNRKSPSESHLPATNRPLLQSDVNIEDTLIQHLVRLDGQGLFFGTVPDIPPVDWDVNKVHHQPIPIFFQDFHSAHRCWDSLMDRALQFYRRTLFNRKFAPSSSDSPAAIARQFTSLQKQLSSFETTFQPILDGAISSNGTTDNPPALLISLYLKCTSILLARIPRDSEMVYDTFLPDFRYIVRTCHLLISSQEDLQLPRNPRFSFEVGVIPPLHVVATKCRDPVTRREAMDLLWSNSRQEGMWDSVLSARIGKWLMSAEEEGLLPPQLPDRKSSMPGLWDGSSVEGQYARLGGSSPDSSSHRAPEMGRSVNEPAALSIGGGALTNTEQQRESKGKGKMRASPSWVVPEGNRIQLQAVEFHIPDRCIKVKAQKMLLDPDGISEEREAVIAW